MILSTHDPRQVVEDIRSHLAACDRRLVFLFGAGTSCSVNVAPPSDPSGPRPFLPLIPGVEALTERCRTVVSGLSDKHEAAWALLSAQCIAGNVPVNVESVLSKVLVKIEAVGDGESLIGLTQQELLAMRRAIGTTIAREVQPSDESIPPQIPHDWFSDWTKRVSRTQPLEIFTTNYDMLFERSLESAGVPVFDGFVGVRQPFFFPDCLDDETLLPGPRWVRLWKMHGSVNWRKIDCGSSAVIIRDQPSEEGELILPSHMKYEESRKRPYIAYMDRLSRLMNQDHSLLVTCGYSFGDEHINSALYSALDNRSTSNVIALLFGDLSTSDRIVQAALRRPNLSLIARNGGVLAGAWGEWKLAKPVDYGTHAFMDLAFDSAASAEDAGSPAGAQVSLGGRMRLGNFYWLTRFLVNMGGA